MCFDVTCSVCQKSEEIFFSLYIRTLIDTKRRVVDDCTVENIVWVNSQLKDQRKTKRSFFHFVEKICNFISMWSVLAAKYNYWITNNQNTCETVNLYNTSVKLFLRVKRCGADQNQVKVHSTHNEICKIELIKHCEILVSTVKTPETLFFASNHLNKFKSLSFKKHFGEKVV